jgi:hypothetical protein
VLGLFKKPYTIRHYEAQTLINGYASAPYTDTTQRLNVQPLTPDELMALPEGDRTVKRIKTFGKLRLASADEFEGIPGDRLFYNGRWFECTSSVMWDHTFLAHYRSDFTILPQKEQMPDPPPPPDPEPPDPPDTPDPDPGGVDP